MKRSIQQLSSSPHQNEKKLKLDKTGIEIKKITQKNCQKKCSNIASFTIHIIAYNQKKNFINNKSKNSNRTYHTLRKNQ